MRRNITAFTAPTVPAGGKLVPFVTINRDADGDVDIGVRDAAGVEVTVEVPRWIWKDMADEIFVETYLSSLR